MSLKQTKLSSKYALFSAIVVTLSVGVTAFACLLQIRGDLNRQAYAAVDTRLNVLWELVLAKDKLIATSDDSQKTVSASNLIGKSPALAKRIAKSNFQILDGVLIAGVFPLNDIHDDVDKIRELFGGTAVIFMKDVPVSTSVTNKDGTKAVGSKLQEGRAYDAALKKGQSFRGEVSFGGVPYFGGYDPIKNQQGEVIGALYVGVPKADFFAAFNRTSAVMAIIALLLIAVVSIPVQIGIRRSMQPLQEGVGIANALAEGDLTARIQTTRKDEIGQMLTAMENMIDHWKEIVGDVKRSADSMSVASEQLSHNSKAMSDGAVQQAERASQVASASEEMSQTISEIAQNTSNIAATSTQAARIAREGEEIVVKSLTEIKEIADTVSHSAGFVRTLGDSSRQIGEIIDVINDIADQTNLLALNAAIEAARAGEQGRGFAVVADEVRKLAERTANSTTEIAAMIKTIQGGVEQAVGSMETVSTKVDRGVEFSSRAGHALRDIVGAVEGLQLMVQQIASAAEEMSTASEQIQKDIVAIASFSREASGNSEQTARSSAELRDLSVQFQSVVGSFKLN